MKITSKDDPICSSAGCTQYKHPHEKPDHDVDYYVPNYGPKDVVLNHNDESLAYAEAKLGHKWNWSKTKDDVKKDYFVPNFGMDADIADSLKNMKGASDANGTWDLPKDDWFVQTESDPICSSAGCGQYKHPKKDRGYDINYPVADWGEYDQDIANHNDNLKVAEKIVGHHWNFILEKPPLNPAKKTLYDYSPKLEGDMIDAKASLEPSIDMLSHPYAAWMTKK